MSSPAFHQRTSNFARLSLRFSQSTGLRAALLLGCLAAAVLAASVGTPEGFLQTDLQLARLLRGMAAIKASIVIASVCLLSWRFGRSVSARIAAVYLLGAWLASGATVLIWQLTFIPLAAAVFHLGELSLLIAAWRDSGGRGDAGRNGP